jgi:hypothetical protein
MITFLCRYSRIDSHAPWSYVMDNGKRAQNRLRNERDARRNQVQLAICPFQNVTSFTVAPIIQIDGSPEVLRTGIV